MLLCVVIRCYALLCVDVVVVVVVGVVVRCCCSLLLLVVVFGSDIVF